MIIKGIDSKNYIKVNKERMLPTLMDGVSYSGKRCEIRLQLTMKLIVLKDSGWRSYNKKKC